MMDLRRIVLLRFRVRVELLGIAVVQVSRQFHISDLLYILASPFEEECMVPNQ